MSPELLFVFLEFQLLETWGLIHWWLCIESLRFLAQTFEFTDRFDVSRSRVILPATFLNSREEERAHFITLLNRLALLRHIFRYAVLGFDDARDGNYLDWVTVLIITPKTFEAL